MAKTQDGKKIVSVKPHTRDGKTVPAHKRSTPNPPKRSGGGGKRK